MDRFPSVANRLYRASPDAPITPTNAHFAQESYQTYTVYHSYGGYETLLDPKTLERAQSLRAIETLSDDFRT